MKELLLSLLLFCMLAASAQKDLSNLKIDTSKMESLLMPDSTGIGTPFGNVVSKMIGQDGGSLASEDGKLELIFPQGALTANTTITIQSTRNMLDSSKHAYQLEPSGTEFKKPVKIIFHYTDEEAEKCPPDLKSFALQDHKGRWSYMEYVDWDSAGKTLSGFIQHFSVVVTDQNDVLLLPNAMELAVNESTLINIYHKKIISSGPYVGDFEDPRFSGRRFGILVNNIPNGNDLVGTASIITNVPEARIAGYTAPANLPSNNPVQVKLAFKYYSKFKKKVQWGSAVCEIYIWGAYKIKVTHTFFTRSGMEGKLIDSATCLAVVHSDNVIISNIQNYRPVVIREGRNGPFREKLYVDDAQGTIHLTEANNTLKPGKSIVYIEFLAVPVVVYKFKNGARGIWSDMGTISEKSLFIGFTFKPDGTTQYFTLPVGEKESADVVIKPYRN